MKSKILNPSFFKTKPQKADSLRKWASKCRKTKAGFLVKKAGSIFVPALLLLFLLTDPVRASEASAAGLLLWFHTLVPVLLPFFILSSLLIALDGLSPMTRLLYPVLHRIFGCSREGCFCLAAGFLCGFPTGARLTGELVRTSRITREEGNYLLGFCNNVSPAFLIGFCMTKSLGRPRLAGPALLLVFGAPVLYGLLTRRGRSFTSLPAEKKTSGSQITFKIADACIMNGLESILKLGCYIILFSMLAGLFKTLPCPSPILTCILTGILEITNGISLSAALLPGREAFSLVLGIAAFGGLSGLAQTQSMTEGSGLSCALYLRAKLVTAVFITVCALAVYHYLRV